MSLFQRISWIITALYRAQQITPLKEALINDKPAAVSVSVMQSRPTSSVCVCVCVWACVWACVSTVFLCVYSVYVKEGDSYRARWPCGWNEKGASEVAETPETSLHKTYPYWCCIYHHCLPTLTWKLLFNALLKKLEGFKCSEHYIENEKGLIFYAWMLYGKCICLYSYSLSS